MMKPIVMIQARDTSTSERVWHPPVIRLREGEKALIVGPTGHLRMSSDDDPGVSSWGISAGYGILAYNIGVGHGMWRPVENLRTRDDVRRYVEEFGPVRVYRLVGANLVRDMVEDKPWPVLA